MPAVDSAIAPGAAERTTYGQLIHGLKAAAWSLTGKCWRISREDARDLRRCGEGENGGGEKK